MLKESYLEWIEENRPRDPFRGRGKCRQVSEAMQKAFPELQLVAGFYECPVWGDQEHWWLMTPENEVVDPTVLQFPSGGFGVYRVLDPDERPVGKCMNCGGYVYRGSPSDYCCSDKCEAELMKDYL